MRGDACGWPPGFWYVTLRCQAPRFLQWSGVELTTGAKIDCMTFYVCRHFTLIIDGVELSHFGVRQISCSTILTQAVIAIRMVLKQATWLLMRARWVLHSAAPSKSRRARPSVPNKETARRKKSQEHIGRRRGDGLGGLRRHRQQHQHRRQDQQRHQRLPRLAWRRDLA